MADEAERRADCPCRRMSCAIHGQCEECRAYHQKKNKLPVCEKQKNRETSKQPDAGASRAGRAKRADPAKKAMEEKENTLKI